MFYVAIKYVVAGVNVLSMYLCLFIGHYLTSDEPYPRGEVWLGGGNVALGYYKNPEKTAEDFHLADGKRWFATGDIGRIELDGSLRIIGETTNDDYCCALSERQFYCAMHSARS